MAGEEKENEEEDSLEARRHYHHRLWIDINNNILLTFTNSTMTLMLCVRKNEKCFDRESNTGP